MKKLLTQAEHLRISGTKPLKPTLKKGWLLLIAIALTTLLSSNPAKAQDPTTIYKDWLILGEDQTNHIDVSYRVVKCTATSGDKIHLRLFNENAIAKTTSFTVTITDVATNQSSTVQVSNYQLAIGEMVSADCNNNGALSIAIPSGYAASNLTVTITF
jgi:hypothetical protein